MGLTITEGLAETKLIANKLAKKRDLVQQYILRQDIVLDPFQKDGGSAKYIAENMQAIKDLEARLVKIRTAISDVNLKTSVAVGGETKTVAEWLAWRREVSEGRLGFLKQLAAKADNFRKMAVESQRKAQDDSKAVGWNLVVEYDEKALHAEIEGIRETLDVLDGRLSLVNATTAIDI